MADIRLAKPAAGTTQTVPSAPDGRFIFDFPADAATLTRSGDNLVLTFEDGASIQLQDFYTTYSKEEMPSFQVEGVEISGQDFFAALGEDLMPAAGPAAGSSASRSGRYNEYGGSDLLDGLDHLGRLDIGFDGGVQLATDTVEPSAYYEDDHGVTVTPSAPGTDPDDPDIPVQGEDFPPTMPHDVLQVDESALDGGSGGGSATAAGSMSVSAPDGVATITIGGVVVWQNGALTGNPVQTDEGHLDVTGFDGTNLTYTYTLDKATQEHGKEGGGENDAIAHEMEVVVTDSDGDSGSAVIRVEITDDVPTIDTAESISLTEGQSTTQSFDVAFGADGAAASGAVTIQGVTADENGMYHLANGTVVINDDNTYTYTADSDAPEGATDSFTLVATDADGDTHTAEVSVSINQSSAPELSVGQVTVDEAHLVPGHTDGGSFSEMVTVTADMLFGAGSNVTLVSAETSTGKGTVRVNEDGSLTYTLTERTEGGSDTSNTADTEADRSTADTAQGDIIKLTVTDAYGNTHVVEVAVNVIDDIPTISTSDMSTSVVPGDSGDNLAKVDETISFTKDENGNALTGNNVKTEWWNGTVHISAAEVTYGGTDTWGNPLIVNENEDGFTLAYSSYNGGGSQSFAPGYGDGAQSRPAPETDWGLTVNGGAGGDWEIQENGNTSEAVVIELDGYAYGITVNFGAFFSGGSNTGTGWDTKSEKALIAFYKEGQLVYSTVVEGTQSGEFVYNTGDVVLEGFDRVVISAVDNGENSDFTIQGIDFITKRDDPIIVSGGTVTAESGADGFADAYADIHAAFDLAGMVKEGTLSEDGTSGTITVLMDGQEQTVTLTLSKGNSGDSILTGTLADGEQLFTATLDKDGNWTMEQYEQFRVPGDGQESNQFELVFKTEDADGDVASTTVHVPLEVVDQTPATDTSIDNGNDTITITGGEGIAGTVAAGDSGGVEVQTTVQPGQDYNISIMLDLSGSMNDPSGSAGMSRLDMAKEALTTFINDTLAKHDGEINLQLITFNKTATEEDTWVLKSGTTEEIKNYNQAEIAKIVKTLDQIGKGVEGTNYEAAMEKATEWFSKDTAEDGVAGNGGENLAFFISDGQPTYYYGTDWWGNPKVEGEGNYSNQETVRQTLEAAQDLQNAGSGVQVNAIGIGTSKSLHEKAQTILDLIDNTGGSEQTQTEYPCQHQVQVGTGRLGTPKYEWQWTTGEWEESKPLILGDSDLVDSKDGLTAALVGGGTITSTELADAGGDKVDASDSTSSAIIYGDVMNTDRLLYELKQLELSNLVMAGAVVSALPGYGSGSEVFQWLEGNGDRLTGDYAGWTHDDTLKYMLEHAEELGYETRVDGNGEFYLVTADGTVLNMDGTEANVGLDSLTGRGGGNDTIIGSQADDVIYGQEGNDLLVGDAPSESGEGSTVGSIEGTTVASIKAMDTDGLDAFIQSVEGTDADGDDRLFGGTGDDVLLGMGGDDYIDGGAGEDAIFGGSGNDIIVYDSNDYLVSGGSGIDFMVSDNSTLTLTELLSGGKDGKDGPIVDSIEVLLKGDAALSLTSIQELADKYGITLGTNDAGQETLTLDMSKWTAQQDGSYDFKGDADLTLETNLQQDSGASSDSDGEMAQQVFILQNSNS